MASAEAFAAFCGPSLLVLVERLLIDISLILHAAQVYHPCVLLAKKRYVGFMYESPGQAAPTFDAKGIETVRRDTCGAVAKMMERTLRILFTSKDLSQVR